MKNNIDNFNEGKVEVKTGINVRKDGATTSSSRILNNAIRITAEGKSVHFIQFITRQVPKRMTFGCDVFLHCSGNPMKVVLPTIIFSLSEKEEVRGCFFEEEEKRTGVDIGKLKGEIVPLLKSILTKQKGFKNAYQIKALKPHLGEIVKIITGSKQDPFQNYGWDVVNKKMYMDCLSRPKWKLDVVDHFEDFKKNNQTIYYEEKGVNKRVDQSLSMYDEPGGRFSVAEERSVFCTFVIVDNRVVSLVQWSKQSNSAEEVFYTVEKRHSQNYLSHWAVKLLKGAYSELTENSPGYTELLTYQPKMDQEKFDFEKEELQDFLKWPKRWITCKKFPMLFSKDQEVFEEEEKKTDFGLDSKSFF